MSVKALKKQLLAAIAMVLVSAISLGSSTFAWFITNKQVKATVSQISAKSNAAFLNIKYGETAVDSNLTADVATLNSTELYPAQWAKHKFENSAPVFTDTNKTAVEEGTTYQFETATAKTVDASTMDLTTLRIVGDPDTAVSSQYAVSNTFNVSSKDTDFTNLKVRTATMSIASGDNEEFNSALRVLVKCGDNWVLVSSTGIVSSSSATTGLLAESVTHGKDTAVTMYVFYDGSDSHIRTNNLTNLGKASARIVVEFEATPPVTQ